jgi:hypothetical protein
VPIPSHIALAHLVDAFDCLSDCHTTLHRLRRGRPDFFEHVQPLIPEIQALHETLKTIHGKLDAQTCRAEQPPPAAQALAALTARPMQSAAP